MDHFPSGVLAYFPSGARTGTKFGPTSAATRGASGRTWIVRLFWGDQYTFIALEERTKMVMAWHLGKRDRRTTEAFIAKVRRATAAEPMFDVSTDAFVPYEAAIDGGLFERANHAQIVKLFSRHVEEGRERYSPAEFVSVAKDAVTGMPDLERASTSHVERKNGSLRQWCKRLTRLTYAYSKSGSTCTRRARYTSRTTISAAVTAR